MTICISAICTEKGEEYIVFAVDHMITTANGEFEHPIKKYEKINKNTIAMFAGDALLMQYFMNLENFEEDYNVIQKTIQHKFIKKRNEIIEQKVLSPLFLDKNFIQKSLEKPLDNPFIKTILMQILETKLDSAILLIGFEENKAQISKISDGDIYEFRNINFHAIGSGAQQAQNTLLFQKHSIEDNLLTTFYNVYKAKKNSEVKQGVGIETEIGYLNEDKMFMLTKKDINILNNIYKFESRYGKTHKDLEKIKTY